MGSNSSKAERLGSQGECGARLFLKSGKLREISMAVRLLGQAVDATPHDHPDRAMVLMRRGYWSGFLYERTGSAEVFADSLKAYEESFALAPPGHRDRPIMLVTFGDLLMKRYQREKTAEDLERAAKAYNEAVTITSSGQPFRMTSMLTFCEFLTIRFRESQNAEDINRAIEYCLQAGLEAGPTEMPEWGFIYLSACHLAKYEATKETEDLEQAFASTHGGFQDEPEDLDGLDALTRCWAAKARQTQSLDDISQAVDMSMKAAQKAQSIQLQWEERLCTMSDMGDLRYYVSKDLAHLDECIVAREELVKLLCPADPARTRSLHLLCDFCFRKYRAENDVKILKQAISAGEEAMSAMRPWPDHPDKAVLLDLLCSCYAARFAEMGSHKDLEKAISTGEDALKRLSPEDGLKGETTNKVRSLKVDGFYEEPENVMQCPRPTLTHYRRSYFIF
ncbi:hypothetical protein HRG_001896 [Hirsutella rhossiliensis]|uniref:Uncharacterized protein n=1 Tax=Hirsutella rhossiliensis TaxID=111463 RepID=A0A9P8N4J6_9HYPO|nr:uncharacterized protein HRG_01896 [Hirsutella rhossiliensis]KAH0966487.1 hypothetical protein HRG_01896 [Hirsutella rhossiliensis]